MQCGTRTASCRISRPSGETVIHIMSSNWPPLEETLRDNVEYNRTVMTNADLARLSKGLTSAFYVNVYFPPHPEAPSGLHGRLCSSDGRFERWDPASQTFQPSALFN